MRKFILILIFTLSICGISAQSPALINYQAVVRDANGSLITSGTISLGISIHDAIVGGNQLYFETHNGITPNSFGIVNVLIGGGTVLSGNFLMLNWGSGDKFLQVYVNSNPIGSRTQMVSVPYALHANRAGKADSANYATQVKNLVTNGATSGQGLTYNGTNFVPTDVANEIAVYNESLAHSANSATILINSSWVTLALNNTQYQTPTGSSISRNGNIITLQPGTYLINAYLPISHYGQSEGLLRFQNLTLSITELKGESNGVVNAADIHLTHMLNGIVVVSGTNPQSFVLEFLMYDVTSPVGGIPGSVPYDTGNYITTNIIIQKIQ